MDDGHGSHSHTDSIHLSRYDSHDVLAQSDIPIPDLPISGGHRSPTFQLPSQLCVQSLTGVGLKKVQQYIPGRKLWPRTAPYLGVVGHKEGEAARFGNQVVQGSLGDGEAIMRGGPPAQLVYDDKRPPRG